MNGCDEGGVIGEGMYFRADGSLCRIYSINFEEFKYELKRVGRGEQIKGE